MLRDRRKSLTLERRSPPPDQSRLQRGSERRGSFAAPSNSLLHPPSEPRHHERRGSLVTRWFKHISEAAEAYKQRDGRNRRADAAAAAAAAAQHDLDASEHPDKTKDVDDSTTTPSGADLLSPPRATNGHGHGHDESPSPNSESTPLLPSPSPSPSPAPSHPDTPESIARRMEKLRRKDEAIKQALAEKQQLVADILHVPKDEFDTIAEIAGEPATEKEASELILAAVNQANQLSAMVNEALRVTEEDAVSAGVMTSSSRSRTPTSAGVPAHRLNAIATSLNAQLTQLLSVLVQRDDERERLRRELQRSREQLHALHEQRASQGHDDQLTREPGAASLEACLEATLEEANHTGEETDPASSNNPVSESAIASTTAQEVFVDALSGEAESHLEAAGAAEGETLALTRTADSAD